MDFYTQLSYFYDDLFPVEPSILHFLIDTFSSSQRILDVACGTGTYAISLLVEGKDVGGIDLSLPMIEQARGKLRDLQARTSPPEGARLSAENTSISPQPGRAFSNQAAADLFQVGDMRDLSRFPPESFQGLYCIGNSLPHLETGTEIRTALAQFYRVLEPGGILLLQTINFDRVRFVTGTGIVNESRFSLPSLQGKRAELVRYYTTGPDPDHINFESELCLPKGQRLKSRVPLFFLTRNKLQELLQDAGFTPQTWYGSYEGTPHDPESSFLSIVTSRR